MLVGVRLSCILFFITKNVFIVNCANILAVFPTPSISHQLVFRPLMIELVRRGHQVTVVTTDPAFPKNKAPVNLTEIDVHDLSYKIWDAVLEEKTGIEDVFISQISLIYRLISEIFEAQLATEEFKYIINSKKEHFDLIFIEAYVSPALILSHIFKAPLIQFSSFGGIPHNFKTFGASSHPLLYPMVLSRKLYNMTNLEKCQQLYSGWLLDTIFASVEQEDNTRLQRMFGQDTPSIQEMRNDAHMLFLNNHPIWADNQPVPPNIVYVGGIHKNPAKKLPTDLETLLNKSRNGVIYFSLGTNVKPSLLPSTKIQMMIKVFSQLPYDVIWKWDQDSLPGITDNIKIYRWLPQSDLLRHPKIKLFITQAGLQSTDEAIDAGVPLIAIPMLADQWYNSEKYVYHKIGLKLDLDTLTEEMFKQAIQTVISDKSYRENIKRFRSIVEDEPQTPLERAVWWTEYVLRHGGAKHLRAAGANISWSQYLEIELVITIVLILISVLPLLCFALYKALRILRIATRNIKIKTL